MCVVLHNPEVKKMVLKEEVLVIIEETEKDTIKGLSRQVQIHKLNLNEALTEDLLSWVRSTRVFKKRAGQNKSQDIRNMFNVTLNQNVIV